MNREQSFLNWFDTFLNEKNIPYKLFEIRHNGNDHLIDNERIIELIKIASRHEQEEIKKIIIGIDFKNGDINHFFEHLAKGFIQTHY